MKRVKEKLSGVLTKKEAEALAVVKDLFEEFNYEDDVKETFYDQIDNTIDCDTYGWAYFMCFIEELFNNCDIIEED